MSLKELQQSLDLESELKARISEFDGMLKALETQLKESTKTDSPKAAKKVLAAWKEEETDLSQERELALKEVENKEWVEWVKELDI